MDKKIFSLVLTLILVQPVLASAFVSLSATGTTIPTTIEPGSNVNLILTLTNIGNGNADSVKLTITPNSYMTTDQYIYTLQTIQAGSSIQVVIPLKISQNIPEGSNALFFSVDYTESGSGTRTLQNSVTISVTKRRLIEIANVSYSEDLIQPGDTVTMKIEMQNLGKGVVKDLTVSLNNISSLFVPIGSDTEVYVGSFLPSTKTTASFNLIVNKNVDTIAYNIPVTLTYYDESNTLHVDQRFVGIKISGKPDFVISLESQQNMFAGSTGTVSISISNSGTATAQFLTAKFDSKIYLSPSEYYVGNLNPDDSSTISLDVNLAGVKPGSQPLNMTLNYKDPYNKDYSETRILQLDVTSRPIQISANMQIIIFLIIIAIVYWKRNSIRRLIKRK